MTKYTDMNFKLTALTMPVSSAENLCKQFGLRSGPIKCSARSGSKQLDTGSTPDFFFFFLKNSILKKSAADKKIPRMQRVNIQKATKESDE